MKRIILASASPRRRELLAQIGIEFEVVVSHKEERYRSSEPQEIVKELALMKAENAESELEKSEGRLPSREMTVIGADTIVVLDGKILGKPKDEAEAFDMLMSLQGRPHLVFTGVALLNFSPTGERTVHTHAAMTKVFIHQMSQSEILSYIQTKEPMDKAGAYGIQGRFAAFIDRIEGDYYNVVGLPVSYLYQRLKSMETESAAFKCKSRV